MRKLSKQLLTNVEWIRNAEFWNELVISEREQFGMPSFVILSKLWFYKRSLSSHFIFLWCFHFWNEYEVSPKAFNLLIQLLRWYFTIWLFNIPSSYRAMKNLRMFLVFLIYHASCSSVLNFINCHFFRPQYASKIMW